MRKSGGRFLTLDDIFSQPSDTNRAVFSYCRILLKFRSWMPIGVLFLFFAEGGQIPAIAAGNPQKPNHLSSGSERTISSVLAFTDSNLPIVIIDTNGESIPDGVKIDAEMGIIDNGAGHRNAVTDPFNNFSGHIGIEIRGQSSAMWPKKQWNIETRNEDGSNRNVSLLGLPSENDWILNGPFIDKSMMRNVLIYRLSREMGRYASRTRFCEVVLNDEYQGVYVLLEKIKRDSCRVDISRLRPEDNEGDELTGGYILKVDKWGNDSFGSKYSATGGSISWVTYQYHYPEDDKITEAQKTYIQNWMYEFEDMMASDSYADPNTGYTKYIATGSFVDHFILNELAKNVDGFRLSEFMYKEKDSKGGQLHSGPIWDFNLAFGNANFYGAESTEGWELLNYLDYGDYSLPPFWWYELFDDSTFKNRIYERWISLRQDVLDVSHIDGLIDVWADTLAEAVERNFEIWWGPGELGTGYWWIPEIFSTFTTYADETDFLKSWIADRIAWMDDALSEFSGVETSSQIEIADRFHLYPNAPNPFNGETVLRYDLDCTASIRLDVYDIVGRKLRTLVNGRQTAGSLRVVWDGKSDSGAPASSGVYVARLTDGKAASTIKMILMQ